MIDENDNESHHGYAYRNVCDDFLLLLSVSTSVEEDGADYEGRREERVLTRRRGRTVLIATGRREGEDVCV